MKKLEYDNLILSAQNPYLGFKLKFTDSIVLTDKDRDKYYSKIESYGYCVYVAPGGIISDDFLVETLSIVEEKSPTLIYCDEENGGVPFFKPDFSPDTFDDFFYLGGLVVVRADLFKDGKGVKRTLTPDMYRKFTDVILSDFCEAYEEEKSLEARKDGVVWPEAIHIPRVLFFTTSPADYRTYVEADNNISVKDVKISAVILSKDNPELVCKCIDSIKNGADMPMEFIVVDNGSTGENRIRYERALKPRNVSYHYRPMDFIYSALCNYGASFSNKEYILFLNDDVLLPDDMKGFPSKLFDVARRDHVGAVGVKLLYPPEMAMPDGSLRIQHIGMTQLKMGPSHKLATYPDNATYEMGRNQGIWDVMGVTGACLLINRRKFNEVSGFDESIKVSYTDTDLCLDLFEKGYYNVCVNSIYLYHYESITRGADAVDVRKLNRLKNEREALYAKHPWLLEKGDPFYNPNFTSISLDFTPDYTLPWDCVEATVANTLDVDYKEMAEGDLLGAVDRVELKHSTFDGEDDYYEIEGWCIMHKKDQLVYDKKVVLTDGNTKLSFDATFKYREELGQIFPDEKNQLLSGFICKIKHDAIPDNIRGKLKVCLALEGKSFFGKTKQYYRETDMVIR